MSRSSNLRATFQDIDFGSAEVLIRIALGILLLANLVAAGFAFHWWGNSPQSLESKIEDTRKQIIVARGQLARSKMLSAKILLAHQQGGSFLNAYMTPRKSTYSTILGELDRISDAAGVKRRDASITAEHIEGSDSLSQLTISASYEANYASLLKFVNLLDRSERFLIIESLAATPLASSANLLVAIKLDTFVRDDVEDQS